MRAIRRHFQRQLSRFLFGTIVFDQYVAPPTSAPRGTWGKIWLYIPRQVGAPSKFGDSPLTG